MPRLNAAGEAVMGVGAGPISIDGSVPAALSGFTGGYWGWFNATNIYGPGENGGAWQVYGYDTVGMTASLIDANSFNFFAAGGGAWAGFTATATGVTKTSIGAIATLSGAQLLDVSPTGQVVVVDNYQAGLGLTVYDSSGTPIVELPEVSLASPYVRLRDNYLAYKDLDGWHLLNVVTNTVASWRPRLDTVIWVVPVLIGTTLLVVEGGTQFTVRTADRAQGYVISTAADFFNPDAVAHPSTSGAVRIARSSDAGESAAALIEVDLTFATGVYQVGTVVAGSVVFGSDQTYTVTTFDVGPLEGNSLTNSLYPPLQHPVVDQRRRDLISDPWEAWARNVGGNLDTVSAAVENIPLPVAPSASFGRVLAGSNTEVAAFQPNDLLTFTSADGTVTFTVNPVTRVIDFSTPGSGDVVGPASAGDGNVVLFDGTTGKLIKDGGTPSDLVEAAGSWECLTDGDLTQPELIFLGGDVVMVFVPA